MCVIYLTYIRETQIVFLAPATSCFESPINMNWLIGKGILNRNVSKCFTSNCCDGDEGISNTQGNKTIFDNELKLYHGSEPI